ncbi:MAG: hypothetical protein KJ062_07765, partial [Thermoanaerobaculia bacterium]|nr:hypothetical protein [Thermoanaerobaculia bacterium]
GGEGFARFWRGYPRKVQKGDALKAWKAIKGSDRALALTAVSAYAIAWERAPEEQRKFIPYPATWLRAGQWADDPEEWRRAAAARQGTSGAPGRSQRPSITPPGFRAEDELPGTSKLDCLTVEEIGDPEPPPSPPPAPAGGGVWPAILERLRGVVDERDFDTWFRPTRQSGEVNGTLRVVVASELFRRDVPREYGDALRSACVAEGVNVPIEFIVNRGEP